MSSNTVPTSVNGGNHCFDSESSAEIVHDLESGEPEELQAPEDLRKPGLAKDIPPGIS